MQASVARLGVIPVAESLIGLGSNLGDRAAVLQQAVAEISRLPSSRVIAVSRFLETVAATGGEQPAFLNAAIRIETSLEPMGLLGHLQSVENRLGRVRADRWGVRTVDLDILLYDQQVLRLSNLQVPHPRMAWRRFVLEPAAEIAGEMIHPTSGWSIGELLLHLDRADEYVAICGPPGAGKSRLASRVAQLVRGSVALLDVAPEMPAPDSPSENSFRFELEWLQLRAERIARPEGEVERAVPRLSDFWLGQSLVYARNGLDDRLFSAFSARWDEVQPRVLRPRLVVFLDRPGVGDSASDAADVSGELPRRLRDDLLDRVLAPRQSPALVLDGLDADWAVVEVAAAIQAMKGSRA